VSKELKRRTATVVARRRTRRTTASFYLRASPLRSHGNQSKRRADALVISRYERLFCVPCADTAGASSFPAHPSHPLCRRPACSLRQNARGGRGRRRIGRERRICLRTDRDKRSPKPIRRRFVRFCSSFSASPFESELLFVFTALTRQSIETASRTRYVRLPMLHPLLRTCPACSFLVVQSSSKRPSKLSSAPATSRAA
jgi:hypothetical protein